MKKINLLDRAHYSIKNIQYSLLLFLTMKISHAYYSRHDLFYNNKHYIIWLKSFRSINFGVWVSDFLGNFSRSADAAVVIENAFEERVWIQKAIRKISHYFHWYSKAIFHSIIAYYFVQFTYIEFRRTNF